MPHATSHLAPLPVFTLTPNPAIDQTVHLPALRAGEVNVATHTQHNAGGKGINVASCLADWGTPVVASGLLGQDNAAPFAALFAQKGVIDACVRLPGRTRTNIKLLAADTGDTTDINLPGPAVPPAAWQALLAAVRQQVQPGQWVVAAGSLPPDLRAAGYAPLLALLVECGAHVVLDTSGPALAQALNGPHLPVLIKPNRHELQDWAGRPLRTTADVLHEARALLARGVGAVAVSLGAEGALIATPEGAWQAAPLPVTPLSTVGAGDAQVAGLVAARHAGLPWREALALGVAFATAKLRQIGPHLPARTEVQALAAQVELQALPTPEK
ncbi:MAG: 1-phosphofructokinase [Pseudomonadota bacterium]|nr:1-phosphofructokinase [Pseudomonadota bacterium]